MVKKQSWIEKLTNIPPKIFFPLIFITFLVAWIGLAFISSLEVSNICWVEENITYWYQDNKKYFMCSDFDTITTCIGDSCDVLITDNCEQYKEQKTICREKTDDEKRFEEICQQTIIYNVK